MADSLFNMNPYFNLNALSGGITGIADFGPELAYHLANLRANESGGGAAGLAAGRASNRSPMRRGLKLAPRGDMVP